MTPTVRAFYGALVGALTVLLAHPFSRPYVLQGVWFLDDSKFLRSTDTLTENIDAMPEPRTFEDAAFWVTTACAQENAGKELTPNQCLLMIEVVQAAEGEDPDNAFWRQCEAVFQRRLGNDAKATEVWKSAANASRWEDYQVKRLDKLLDGLAKEDGRNLAWHYAVADSRKSSAVSLSLFYFARQSLRGANVGDFAMRLATLRNGKLLRDGARSVEAAAMGTEMIELAAYCSVSDAYGLHGVGGPISPHKLILAREDFLRIAADQSPQDQEEIRKTFQEDDAREAFIDPKVVDDNRRELMLSSILTSALPGALISIGILGLAFVLLGWALSSSRSAQVLFAPPAVFLSGAIAAAVVYLSTRLFFPSLWAAVLLWSFAIRHDKERQAVPHGLGSAYRITIVALAVGFVVVLASYFVSRSLPGEYLFGIDGGAPALGLEGSSLLALTGFIASLSLVTAPVWGFIERISSNRLVGKSLVTFGLWVCLGSFALGVILVPAAIGLDRSVGDALAKTFQNEPSYYLTQ
jgi:hypothetical protein